LFSRMDMLFGGEPMRGMVLAENGWLLLVMPPGAFFSLALAIAAKNAIDRRRKDARTPIPRRARTLNR